MLDSQVFAFALVAGLMTMLRGRFLAHTLLSAPGLSLALQQR
jgi:hypothetical protein